MKTRAQLRVQAARNLGVLAQGQPFADEDSDTFDDLIDPMLPT